jgi:hypothetical protein
VVRNDGTFLLQNLFAATRTESILLDKFMFAKETVEFAGFEITTA